MLTCVPIYVQFDQLYFNKNEAVDLRCISDDNKRRCLLGHVPITRSFSSYLGIFWVLATETSQLRTYFEIIFEGSWKDFSYKAEGTEKSPGFLYPHHAGRCTLLTRKYLINFFMSESIYPVRCLKIMHMLCLEVPLVFVGSQQSIRLKSTLQGR